MKSNLSQIKHWVFDLDHTLYSPEIRLFDQIEVLMNTYLKKTLNVTQEKAIYLRQYYWEKYGTTLAGLMAEHEIDPDYYLEFVHNINLNDVKVNLKLASYINSLTGNKIVFTNGSRMHAKNVSKALGLYNCFSGFYGTEDAKLIPKPHKKAFENIFKISRVNPKSAVMFEDDPRNLVEPFKLGMKTVLVGDYFEADYIHFHTPDLNTFFRDKLNG